jgi:hypothetical protein
LASQRITIAKVGGLAADVILPRFREWSAARCTDNQDPGEWSSEQWPQEVRKQADDFAERLRAHAFAPPVVHFIEWADLWSMGDLFDQWLTPPDGPTPLVVYADRFQLFGYALPDRGRLSEHLASAGPQQSPEEDCFVRCLHEAVTAWQELVERAVVVVLRQNFQASALDEEVVASLSNIPEWLT